MAVGNSKEAESALRAWIAALPAGIAEAREPKIEVDLKVVPTKPGAMGFAVGFSSPDELNFYWGDGFRAEQIPADSRLLLRVCDAIRAGRVTEDEWTVWGKRAWLASTIDLGDDQFCDRIIFGRWLFRKFAKHTRRHQYAAWD